MEWERIKLDRQGCALLQGKEHRRWIWECMGWCLFASGEFLNRKWAKSSGRKGFAVVAKCEKCKLLLQCPRGLQQWPQQQHWRRETSGTNALNASRFQQGGPPHPKACQPHPVRPRAPPLSPLSGCRHPSPSNHWADEIDPTGSDRRRGRRIIPKRCHCRLPIGAIGRLSAGRASRMEMNSGNEAPGSEIYCARRCLTGLPSGWMGEEGTRGAKCPPTSALVLLVHIALPIPLGLLNGKGPSVAFCRAAGGWRLIINGRRRQIRAAQRHRQKTGSSACLRGNKWADDG